MTKAVLIILPPPRDTLSGFSDGMRGRHLKADGVFHEIISWKLAIFAPNDVSGVGVLANVLERYQVDSVCERVAP